MIVTDIEMKDFMYSYLKGSDLVSEVSGSLYKDQRPLNSQKEDVIISVLARNAVQLQSFTLNINVYVPKIKRGQDYIDDTKRLRLLSSLSASLFTEHVKDQFIFTMDSQAIMDANGIDFSVINNRVRVTAYTSI